MRRTELWKIHYHYQISLCTLIVTFGPYISRYYLFITILLSLVLMFLIHIICARKRLHHQEESCYVRKDARTKRLILRNRTVGIPGQSQDQLDKFQTFEIEERQKEKIRGKTWKRKTGIKSYHSSIETL